MLLSPVLVVHSHLFVLTNIVNETLYIASPANTSECFITLDIENKFNDSWTQPNWIRMKQHINNITGDMYSVNLKEKFTTPPDVLNYKVRCEFLNLMVTGSEQWQTILWNPHKNDISLLNQICDIRNCEQQTRSNITTKFESATDNSTNSTINSASGNKNIIPLLVLFLFSQFIN